MDETKKEINISMFSDENVISKVKELIAKLEGAETLEAAKEVAVDLKTLIPEEVEDAKDKAEDKEEVKEEAPKEGEEKPEEEKEVEAKPEEEVAEEKTEAEKQLDKVVEEATKEEEKLAEEVKEEPSEEAPVEEKTEEVPAEEKAEEPAEEKPAELSEVLDLNDQLIEKLKEASVQIETLEKEKVEFSDKVKNLESKLAVFKEKEEAKKMEAFNKKFTNIFNKYVNFFGVKENEVGVIKDQMSKFSEDVLDNIEQNIDRKKLEQMKAEPEIVTKSSSELETQEITEDKEVIKWDELNTKDKTDYLFERFINKN